MKTEKNSSHQKIPATKTIAIIQITRLGDLIQTFQATRDLKKTYPNYRLVLIARSQFANPLKFLLSEAFDEIYCLDTQAIFKDKNTKGVKSASQELNSFLGLLKNESIDVLINLSYSKTSNYLSSLITSHYKIGSYFDHNNRLVINDKWSQMLYSTVLRGDLNPFSLVDLYKSIIGIKEAKKPNLKLASKERSKTIIIHPFASSERKSWKVEKWVEVIYKTLKENEGHNIHIVGAKNEHPKAQLIVENPLLKTFSNRILNKVGKTNILELYNDLSQATLFVGHDSMVGHLASLTDTLSLTISLGNVRPQETTPYHANAYNLSPKTKCYPCFPSDACSYHQCHHDIPYQVVSSAISQLIRKKELTTEWTKNSVSDFHASSVNIYRAQIIEGKMRLISLVDSYTEKSDIYRTIYKIAWSFLISEQEEVVGFPRLNQSAHQELLKSLSGLRHLYELSDFGKRYSRYILEEIASSTPSIIKIKEYSKKIDEIDSLQKMVQKTSPELGPVIDYFTIRKANLHGDNIVTLTESSYSVFEESADLCRLMYELIESTVAEYKTTQKQNSLTSR